MKTVFITGISRGIGKATAQKFIAENFYVIGGSQSGNKPFENNNLHVYKLNLANTESIDSVINELKNNGVKIDYLINNAGILIDKGNGVTQEILRKTLEVNLLGLIDFTEKMIPFIQPGGHIISLSSGLGSISDAGSGGYTAYRISKAAINMYTRTLAARLRPNGITVSSIDPGWVKTDMGGFSAPRKPEEPANEIFNLTQSKIDSGYFWNEGRKKNW